MRPERIVLVCGTGTEVGKTWVAGHLLNELKSRGLQVAARKPVQSFDVDDSGAPLGGATDAEVLAGATGEAPEHVCHPSRSYHRAMAPPMAADVLGLPSFSIGDLVEELVWPDHRIDVGLVEMAGGVRSPQATDGDVVDFVKALLPDLVILVGDAGLGTINGVRLSMDALFLGVDEIKANPVTESDGKRIPIVVVLNRYDGHHELHQRNLQWLAKHDGFDIVTLPGEISALADLVIS